MAVAPYLIHRMCVDSSVANCYLTVGDLLIVSIVSLIVALPLIWWATR